MDLSIFSNPSEQDTMTLQNLSAEESSEEMQAVIQSRHGRQVIVRTGQFLRGVLMSEWFSNTNNYGDNIQKLRSSVLADQTNLVDVTRRIQNFQKLQQHNLSLLSQHISSNLNAVNFNQHQINEEYHSIEKTETRLALVDFYITNLLARNMEIQQFNQILHNCRNNLLPITVVGQDHLNGINSVKMLPL